MKKSSLKKCGTKKLIDVGTAQYVVYFVQSKQFFKTGPNQGIGKCGELFDHFLLKKPRPVLNCKILIR